MSSNKNPNEFFNKIKNINYKEHINTIKNIDYKSHFNTLNKKKDEILQKLSKEKEEMNRKINENTTKKVSYSDYLNYFKSKSKLGADQLYNNLKNINYKEKAEKIQEKANEFVSKASEKIKEKKLDENLKKATILTKEKLGEISDQTLTQAKTISEGTKKKLGDNFGKFKDFASKFNKKIYERATRSTKNIGYYILASIFVYGLGTSLPPAYYEYKKYVKDQENREKDRNNK